MKKGFPPKNIPDSKRKVFLLVPKTPFLKSPESKAGKENDGHQGNPKSHKTTHKNLKGKKIPRLDVILP